MGGKTGRCTILFRGSRRCFAHFSAISALGGVSPPWFNRIDAHTSCRSFIACMSGVSPAWLALLTLKPYFIRQSTSCLTQLAEPDVTAWNSGVWPASSRRLRSMSPSACFRSSATSRSRPYKQAHERAHRPTTSQWPTWNRIKLEVSLGVTGWRHQMETFSVLLALSAGNSPVTGDFLLHRPVTRSFDVFFDWMNGWVNNCEAGDLRRHRARYYVTVMRRIKLQQTCPIVVLEIIFHSYQMYIVLCFI